MIYELNVVVAQAATLWLLTLALGLLVLAGSVAGVIDGRRGIAGADACLWAPMINARMVLGFGCLVVASVSRSGE